MNLKVALTVTAIVTLTMLPLYQSFTAQPVFGQTDTFDVQDRIFQQRRYSEEISQLQSLYRQQMEVYRDAERQFLISKGQFKNLENLNSLEQLVKDTHAFYSIRTKVLITYLELMHAVLLETDGVELSLKEQALNDGKKILTELQAHQTLIEQSNDRQSLNKLTEEFEPLYESTENKAHFMMALVMLGNVQQLFDKTVLIQKDLKVKAEQTELSALSRSEFDRSYAEIDRAVFDVRAELQQELERIVKNKDQFKIGNYRTLITSLDKSYSKVSRVISYVDEANNNLEKK